MAGENELSEREKEILRLVATGASNKEIALALSISPNTVKVHLRNVFAKVGAASRTEAALMAVKMGLVPNGTVPPGVAGDDASSDGDEPPLADREGASLAPGGPGPEVGQASRLVPAWLPRLLLSAVGLALLAALVLGGLALTQTGPFAPRPTPTLPQPTAQPAVQPTGESRWGEASALPAARSGLAAVVFEGAIYVIGGESGAGVSGAALRYRASPGGWETLADKPTPVSEIQAAVLGERIFVPGGKAAGGKPVAALEVYSPRLNRWDTLAPLPEPLSGYALAAYEGRLYLFGGWTGSAYSSAVYSYNPAADRWETRASLPSPRAFAAAQLVESRIYVIGGFDGQAALRENLVYIPERDHGTAPAASADQPWAERAPLAEGRYGMGAATITNMIYLVGGVNENRKPGDLGPIQYQVLSDRWAAFERPSYGVGLKPGVVMLDTRLHILGGQSAEGQQARHQTYQAIYTIMLPSIQQ